MTQSLDMSPQMKRTEEGELFAFMLRLHPIETAMVAPGAGNQVQAAFLDMVRQGDPALAEWLHQPNQRRPYTVGLLQGFNHLPSARLASAQIWQQPVQVQPNQVYWLRITMLDSSIFSSFTRHLLARASTFTIRIGEARFEVSRLVNTPDPEQTTQPWVGYTSFAQLHASQETPSHYQFVFATPTAFSFGQKVWGKHLKLFPEPALVFESLARQWDHFAPVHLRLATSDLTPRALASWCEDYVTISHYALETQHLASSQYGHKGFQGHITYEVKGNPRAPEARWLTPLARLALFCGVGYKTTMGMGQSRCTSYEDFACSRDLE